MAQQASTFADRLRPRIGEQVHISDYFDITQDDLDVFATVTRDWDYMHNDPEFAKTGPWGTTIAHGYFLVSLISHFLGDMGFPMVQTDDERMLNYGLDRVRFIEPVICGDRIRARLVLTDLVRRKEGVDLAKVQLTYETERNGETPHMIADVLMLLVQGSAVNEAR